MVFVEGSFKVGHVLVNGVEIELEGKEIPDEIMYLHIVPWEYCNMKQKDRTINCFTNTDDGKAAMEGWLKRNGLWNIYQNGEILLAEVIKYINTKAYETNREEILRTIAKNVRQSTRSFVEKLTKKDLKLTDPDLLKKLNNPEFLLMGPQMHSSLAYEAPNCMGPNPITTDDVMYLKSPSFIPDLSAIAWTVNPLPPPPPAEHWGNKISSAKVPSGCLRLFDGKNYALPRLDLWGGPNVQYDTLGEWDNRAKSLQQA